jgi:NAD(P)H-hydrate repair Nnr-like enzyme with NAD(P)H-hydrate epimerase domain
MTFYGCGTAIDQVKLQDTTQASLEGSLHEKIKSVDCPSGVSVDPGSTFNCDVTLRNGKQMTATLEIRDKEADITIVGLKANK